MRRKPKNLEWPGRGDPGGQAGCRPRAAAGNYEVVATRHARSMVLLGQPRPPTGWRIQVASLAVADMAHAKTGVKECEIARARHWETGAMSLCRLSNRLG